MFVIARRLLADLGHVVLGWAGERLELPAEKRPPELAALGGVVRGISMCTI